MKRVQQQWSIFEKDLPEQIYVRAFEERMDQSKQQGQSDSPNLSSFVDPQSHTQHIPKLEDFLGDSSSMVRYSDSQTETQDSSSLTHMYDQSSTYFGGDHQQQEDLKAITGFQAFSTNSGSEVEDSASMARTTQHQQQLACAEFEGHSIESNGNELGVYNSSCTTNALSLEVTTTQSSSDQKKAIIAVDNDGSKKIADTFGQRTSIYRGVTRFITS
ncbi:hypothetical protein ACFX1X_032747 [Malus domestica]